jgi:hypothetical protein
MRCGSGSSPARGPDRVTCAANPAPGDLAQNKIAMEAMMHLVKLDIAALEAAARQPR